jgi:hypothetical protein
MNERYFPVKLDFLLNDKYTNCDIFLKIGQDYIHYLRQGECSAEALNKLQSKNCKTVFLNSTSVQNYMEFKKNLLKYELEKETSSDKCLNQFIDNYSLLKEFYTGVCGDELKASYIQELGKQSLQVIKKHKALDFLFDKFKQDNPSQVIFKELVAFFSIYSLKYFDQISEDQLEKFNVAILLTDILLEPAEISPTYVAFNPDMSKKILKHPEQAVASVPNDPYFESTTIINLIKNHHETPDGTGYPNRLSFTRFDIFLSTYYIAEQIVLELIQKDLKLNEISSIYNKIYLKHKKFASPNFNKTFNNFENFLKADKGRQE